MISLTALPSFFFYDDFLIRRFSFENIRSKNPSITFNLKLSNNSFNSDSTLLYCKQTYFRVFPVPLHLLAISVWSFSGFLGSVIYLAHFNLIRVCNLLHFKMDGNYYSSYQNGVEKKDFNKTSQNIASSIQKISQNVLSMKKMVNLLGTSQDNQELRQRLHQIQHYTNQLAKDTTGCLKELSAIPMPQSPSEQREHKMLKEKLAEELTTALNAFQDMQRLACQKEREEMHRRREAHPLPGVRIPPPPANRGTASANEAQLIELQDSFQQKQVQAQLDEEQRNLDLIQQQEEAIRQLENDISTVNEIFMDLGALVHSQGEFLDSIEAQVETAEVSVSMGNENLRKASSHANALRKKKCIILIIGTVILLCTITLVFWGNS